MKKSFKILAAALAVSTAMSGFSAAAAAAGKSDTEITEDTVDIQLDGGWNIVEGSLSMKSHPDALRAFRKATKGLTGVKYQPIALLATQVVAGTNYCILCRSTVVYPGAQPEIKLMYIYEDLQGNAEITGFKTIIGEVIPGGFAATDGKVSLKANKDVYKAFKKAMRELTGVSYKPVAYLGSQVVAGTNYLILCRSQVVYPGAPYKYSLVTVYKDLNGNASILDIKDLPIGSYDGEELLVNITTPDDDPEEIPDVGMANPWQEYRTVSEAADAAGVSFKAPKTLGETYKINYIQAMDGIAEVNYTNGKKEICVRKGKGTDDISGDYNEYKTTETVTIAGMTVTLKKELSMVYNATWNDGTDSYSYVVTDGISHNTAVKHIESIIKLNK